MTGDQITVTMTGGGPWGFRLFGGDDDPLVVAKLRKRSKAHDSGLQEGDVLLGINGYSCRGMSHSTAMSISDNSGQTLQLLVLRGTSEKHAVHAAFQALGSQLQAVPASAVPQERATGANKVSQFQPSEQSRPQASDPQVQVRGSPFSAVNGPGAEVRREERTLQDGNTTKHITTETRTEQFGGTKLTKITREEVSQTFGGSGRSGRNVGQQPTFSAPQPQPPRFQVSNVASNKPKPGTWTPSGTGPTVKAGGMTVTAPGGVHVQQHPDQSVTMTIGMHQPEHNEGKENVAPHRPTFNVPVVPTKSKPGVWQPSFTPAPPKPRPPSPLQEPMYEEPSESSDFPKWAFPDGKAEPFQRANAPGPLPLPLTRILHEGSGSDSSGPDTPTGLSKKKKMFGDSAFYDDPEHKYPTIEEQVKMARSVALSLTSPANKKARGHRMFVKRQMKSEKWTKSDGPVETTYTETYEVDSDPEDKFFQPDPWASGTHTWKPSQPPVQRGVIPKAPPIMPNLFAPPVIPKADEEEKAKALSAEEFERMRLYEAKTQHTTIPPQACFALAEDLHNMKGRGGRLFAKRKAKAEKWVVDENTVPPPPPSAELIKKLTGGLQIGVPEDQPDVRSGAIPVNKLKQMIEIPKPAMTPWEAAMEHGGRVDRAFDHLEGITFTKKAGYPGGPTVPLQDLASPASSVGSGPARMPEFSRKIKPWGSDQTDAPSAPTPAGFKPVQPAMGAPVKKPGPPPPRKPWQNQEAGGGGGGQPWAMPDASGAGGSFRPVKFKAPGAGGGASNSGVYAPWQNSSGGSGGGSAPLAAGGGGFCDL